VFLYCLEFQALASSESQAPIVNQPHLARAALPYHCNSAEYNTRRNLGILTGVYLGSFCAEEKGYKFTKMSSGRHYTATQCYRSASFYDPIMQQATTSKSEYEGLNNTHRAGLDSVMVR
jgi:hypothetical protein